ncbi:unnamed protein product [Schistosoma margrebowiei]|uniref:Uncharacterized protein n=1 Tax=Schistosoma margrebowiei TaxID=48269 RepID=A0A183N423_9TREM|nr:unnamed protein product [Schistosoma margrebowiei]
MVVGGSQQETKDSEKETHSRKGEDWENKDRILGFEDDMELKITVDVDIISNRILQERTNWLQPEESIGKRC